MMQRVLSIGGIWLAACGPAAEPEPKTAAAEGASSGAGRVETTPAAVEAAPQTSVSAGAAGSEKSVEPAPPAGSKPSAVPVESKPAAPSIHEVCFAMCDKLKNKCPKSSFEACQLNCGKYDPPAEGCDDVVRSALICARDAADLVCANVAPESCAKSFRRVAACAAGQTVSDAAPESAALPPDFSMYENAPEGIAAPMPRGVTAGEGNTLAIVKHADGAVYSLRKLPRPEGKLNEKIFLKIAMNLFGRCTDKMKMQGMVDKPGRTSIHYTLKCPDGSEEQGLFWATHQALFVAGAKGQPGQLGPTDVFLYGFEVK